MPRRISKLTACQLAALPGIRDEWLARGLSTEPASRQAAEAGIRAAYIAGGLAPPRVIIWLGSPWTGVIGRAVAPVIISYYVGAQVGDIIADDDRCEDRKSTRLNSSYT